MSFGLALGMAITSPRQVTSGYYRNHLYVLLGLNVLATLVAVSGREHFALAPPLAAAIFSYSGAVAWLYEKPRIGVPILWIVAALSLAGVWVNTAWPSGFLPMLFTALDSATSGLVLGLTMAAMFLGHWYLNSPTMAIGPLERLVWWMAGAVVLRAAVEAVGLASGVTEATSPVVGQTLFIVLRWLSGIVGTFVLAIMTWRTLKIPNTQSATGILYVAVITTFLGELTALLLAAGSAMPA